MWLQPVNTVTILIIKLSINFFVGLTHAEAFGKCLNDNVQRKP